MDPRETNITARRAAKRARSKRYEAAHSEQRKAAKKARYLANREKLLAAQKARRDAARGALRAKVAEVTRTELTSDERHALALGADRDLSAPLRDLLRCLLFRCSSANSGVVALALRTIADRSGDAVPTVWRQLNLLAELDYLDIFPGKPNTYRILSLEERRARREAAP